ncbi:hypothetical protein ACIQ9P_07715 [Kitasatospora sp. NPDC094019]|uniref:hypothetical protein n=1 Tax=Kitasatospora sp. NPDC094019 TaxID=3364091 RepID=UPI0038070A52
MAEARADGTCPEKEFASGENGRELVAGEELVEDEEHPAATRTAQPSATAVSADRR